MISHSLVKGHLMGIVGGAARQLGVPAKQFMAKPGAELFKGKPHSIKKVDADTGREVEQDEIIKGYEVSKGNYIELEPEELEAVAIESKRTIDIEQFVPKKEIDELYLGNPYYIVPDGEVGANRPSPSFGKRSRKRAWSL